MFHHKRSIQFLSVNAINATQLQVTFNQPVDKDSALDPNNYSYKLNDGTSDNLVNPDNDTVNERNEAKLTLSDDKKVVIITAGESVATIESTLGITAAGTPFSFTVEGVKTADGKEFPKATFEVKVDDKVAPQLVNASAKASATTKTVTLEFTEPVNAATGVYKVEGKVVTVAQGSRPNEVKLTTDDLLYAGKSYSLEIVNAKDFAGNLITPNPTTSTFTVVADTNIPQVASVTATEDDTIQVVFDKTMNASTVATGITVLDANGDTLPGTTPTISPITGTSKEFTIRLHIDNGIYTNGNTATLNLIFKDTIKDTSGNALVATTKTVTLNKDTVAPKIVNVEMIKNATYTNGAFVVTFDEKVQAPASVTVSDFKLVDQDGLDLTAGTPSYTFGTPVLDPKDAKKVILPLATNTIPSSSKTATVYIAKDVFTDDSLGQNKNAATTISGVSLTATAADKNKPELKDTNSNGIADDVVGNSNPSDPNTITFTITEANLNKATVLNIDNYRLDGKPLPAGSYVTIVTSGSDHTVTIHLAPGSIKEDRSNYAFTISNIADNAGNVMDTVAVNNIQLFDDVAPVFELSP